MQALAAAFAASLASIIVTVSSAAAEQAVDVPTRPGQSVRILYDKPAKPVGSVILLAGGHGRLDLTRDARIGWGAGNQLVRTRAAYVSAGYATAVPDIAGDLKDGTGVVSQYRWSEPHARDIGALVRHLKAIAPPVYLVGTSRAALSVANAATRLVGEERPDAIVITAGMIAHVREDQPSAERSVGRLDRITQPVLIVFHEKDGCPYTPASSAPRAKALFSGSRKVDVELMRGGEAGSGNPCEARSPHGFLGLDAEVVRLVTGWLKALPK
jgi:pimeloyl-ACP methyl ester carboxylesterase